MITFTLAGNVYKQFNDKLDIWKTGLHDIFITYDKVDI